MRIVICLFIISLTSCYVYDNSVDPEAKSFSGYNTVDSLSKISPEGSDHLDKALLISSKYKGQCKYEFQVKLAEVESWDGIPSYFSESNIINASFLNLVADTSYNWRVRGVIGDKTGKWSSDKAFLSINNISDNSRNSDSSWYSSDFIYLYIDGLLWGKNWEVRYKVDNNDYVTVESDKKSLFIEDVLGNKEIRFQFREKDSEITGFWSKERVLSRSLIDLKLNEIISGEIIFTAGSANNDIDTPDTEITLPSGFAIGQYEVSNNEYISVINESLKQNVGGIEIKNGGVYKGEELLISIVEPLSVVEGVLEVEKDKVNHPVVNVTWIGATTYTDLLNTLEGWQEGVGYRLPYETEWEYVASNGATTIYPWGDEFLKTELNYNNSGAIPVGSYTPSLKYSCYDLTGNIWEWCLDSYSSFKYNLYPPVEKKNIRGGSWLDLNEDVFNRSYRSYLNKSEYKKSVGLRVVFQYGR